MRGALVPLISERWTTRHRAPAVAVLAPASERPLIVAKSAQIKVHEGGGAPRTRTSTSRSRAPADWRRAAPSGPLRPSKRLRLPASHGRLRRVPALRASYSAGPGMFCASRGPMSRAEDLYGVVSVGPRTLPQSRREGWRMAQSNHDLDVHATPATCRLRDGTCEGRGRAANPRPRHPAFEELRAAVRELVVSTGVLEEDDALVLVSEGVEAVAERCGVCGRTIRRRCETAGSPVNELVRRVRLSATERAFRVPVPTHVVARWLGFGNTDAYRRFVRREMGVSVKELRLRVRESPVFVTRGH